jgi:hypothetical protein
MIKKEINKNINGKNCDMRGTMTPEIGIITFCFWWHRMNLELTCLADSNK